MLPWSAELAGRIDEHVITSELLRGNPLGDPHERPLRVYVPPGYDDEPDRRYPAVYVIQGYTGHVAMWRNRSPFRQPFPETADAVFAARRGTAARSWSTSTRGPLRRQPVRRLPGHRPVPLLPVRRGGALGGRALPYAGRGREHRAITGKSSGGFGAMITPMLRPDLFGALATHAGDSLYELCYIPEFGESSRAPAGLRRRHLALVGATSARRISFTKEADTSCSSCYGVRGLLLRRRRTAPPSCRSTRTPAVIRPEVWQRWLDWDPVRMVPRTPRRCARCARSGSTRESGTSGSSTWARRRSGAALAEAGVADEVIHFELFEATHGGIDYRYPLAGLAGRRIAA